MNKKIRIYVGCSKIEKLKKHLYYPEIKIHPKILIDRFKDVYKENNDISIETYSIELIRLLDPEELTSENINFEFNYKDKTINQLDLLSNLTKPYSDIVFGVLSLTSESEEK